jgi:hypothetical protein
MIEKQPATNNLGVLTSLEEDSLSLNTFRLTNAPTQ